MPIVINTLPTFTRRSLVNCRRRLAEKLGAYTLVTTDGTPADGASIIASDLAGGLDPDFYRQAWAYPTQTGGVDPGVAAFKLRRVGSQALNTVTGQLAMTVAFPGVVPAGVDVELHKLMPPTRHDGMPGLRACLNMGLAELWTYTRLSIAGVNGAPAYDLSTNDWLDPGAINELYGPPLTSTLNPQAWPGYETIQNADSVQVGVSPTFSTGAVITVGVFRPADTWIKSGGVWASSTTGLQNDTDEQLFNPEILVFVALVHAYHALASQGEESARGFYAAQEQLQRRKVNMWKFNGLNRSSHAMSHGLPSSYGSGDPKDFVSW